MAGTETQTWIGARAPRKEDEALLTGRARFIDDLSPLPGLRYAAILRSPHPHAKIKKIDVSRARALLETSVGAPPSALVVAISSTSLVPGTPAFEAAATRATQGIATAAHVTAVRSHLAAPNQVDAFVDEVKPLARKFKYEVIGAIQPQSFSDPSAQDVAAIISQVKDSGVPAIFGSEVFPSPVLEQIGKETGVQYVDTLRDDDLPGEPGDAEHSYLGLMRLDFVTMITALGGDPSALEAIDVADVAPDTSEYPQ